MFRLCSWCDLTMLVVSFKRYRGMFQQRSLYVLTVLEVCCHSFDVLNVLENFSTPLELFRFDLVQDMFDPLVVCFDSARGIFYYACGMFQRFSWHNLTVPEVCRHNFDTLNVMDRVMIVLVVRFHCARGMFPLFSWHVLTMLALCSNRIRGII